MQIANLYINLRRIANPPQRCRTSAATGQAVGCNNLTKSMQVRHKALLKILNFGCNNLTKSMQVHLTDYVKYELAGCNNLTKSMQVHHT